MVFVDSKAFGKEKLQARGVGDSSEAATLQGELQRRRRREKTKGLARRRQRHRLANGDKAAMMKHFTTN